MKLCLVCSSGGHLLELHSLNELWLQYERMWITFPHQDSISLLNGQMVFWAFCPTNRNLWNLFRNLYLALKILRQENPDVIISSGAGVAVPFILMGRILGKKTVYIELLTRVTTLSLSAKILYFFVDHHLVQWPQLASKYRKAVFKGRII